MSHWHRMLRHQKSPAEKEIHAKLCTRIKFPHTSTWHNFLSLNAFREELRSYGQKAALKSTSSWNETESFSFFSLVRRSSWSTNNAEWVNKKIVIRMWFQLRHETLIALTLLLLILWMNEARVKRRFRSIENLKLQWNVIKCFYRLRCRISTSILQLQPHIILHHELNQAKRLITPLKALDIVQ